jgi:hypothetical protein
MIGIVAVLLLSARLASPFLHTHQFLNSSTAQITDASSHCNACEYEATQAIDAGPAVVLPVTDFANEYRVLYSRSVFVNAFHSTSESRGPPSIS